MNGTALVQDREADDRHGPPAPRVLIAVDDTAGARQTLRSGSPRPRPRART